MPGAGRHARRWLWPALNALLLPPVAAWGAALLAHANGVGAESLEEACGDVYGLGSCMEPQSPTWVLAAAFMAGSAVAAVLLEVLRSRAS